MNRTASTYGPLKTKTLRTVLVLGTLASLGLPALAASGGSTTAQAPRQNTQQNSTQQNAQPNTRQPGQGQQPGRQMTPLKVSYYDADPLRGGKLLGSVTLQPPTRQAGTPGTGRTPAAGAQRTNPLVAQAPKGAKFAVISDPRGGSRVIDLSQAAQDGPGLRGGPGGDRGPGGRGGQDGPGGQNTPSGTPGA